MADDPDLTSELDAAEAIVMGDDATCRYCGGLIVPCTEPIRYCKGWKHAAYLHCGPVGPHYCEGRSINPMAEPGGSPVATAPAAAALADHKAHCPACQAQGDPCAERIRLAREFRAGLREGTPENVQAQTAATREDGES